MSQMNRRTFLKYVGASGTVLYLAPFARANTPAPDLGQFLSRYSPIDRTVADVAPRQYYGDDPDVPHRVLWNKDGMKAALAGQKPRPAEQTDVVIIGGGMAGLTSAYLLRKHKPIVLEQASRFGGNSKGQSWRGIDYSIGAAYVVEPDEGSEIDGLMKELGMKDSVTLKEGEDPVSIGNTIFKEFWSGESCGEDEAAREQFTKLAAYFRSVWDGEEIVYPDIPVTEEDQREYIDGLDRISFKDHVTKIAGGPLHPNIETALEHYCWSSFGASFGEISAACGLNFYTAEFGNLYVFPGGNSAIAERLVSKLSTELSPKNLRPSSLVFEVRSHGNGVEVKYFDSKGAINTIVAKTAIMACPKFVVGRVLQDIEPERLDAIRKLRYNSYLVANVCLKGAPPESFYDLYMLGDGKIASPDVRTETARKGVTDVILGNFSVPGKQDTVLTLYKGVPYQGARAEMYDPKSYDSVRAKFEEQIRSTILPLLKMTPDRIVDLRVARWGHPLPVAAQGLIADKVIDQVRKPFKNRIFFVEQDNWALPAFETAVMEAYHWAPEVEKLLG